MAIIPKFMESASDSNCEKKKCLTFKRIFSLLSMGEQEREMEDEPLKDYPVPAKEALPHSQSV